jgi:peroxiredoxin
MKTRVHIVSVLFIVLFFASCNSKNKFVVTGELSNIQSKYLYLSEYTMVSSKVIDSVKISAKGEFKFQHKISQPGFYQIQNEKGGFIILLVEPGEKIHIAANEADMNRSYEVKGSEGSSQIRLLTLQLVKTTQTLDSLNMVYNSIKNPEKDSVARQINKEYTQAIREQRNFSISFVINHLKSLSSIVALYQQYEDENYVLGQNRDLQYIKLVSDTLQKYYPQLDAVKALSNDKNRLLNSFNTLRLVQMGRNAKQVKIPDLTLPDFEGQQQSLNSQNGRCLLVCFWTPKSRDSYLVLNSLKELDKKYSKKGFGIFTVVFVDKVEGLSNFFTKNNIPGVHVIDKRAEFSNYLSLFNISQFPSTLLLDSNREIIARDIFGEQLDAKLNDILK